MFPPDRGPHGDRTWDDLPSPIRAGLEAYARWVAEGPMEAWLRSHGITKHGQIHDVVAVGSYQHGRADALSDVDVLIVAEGSDVFRSADRNTRRRALSVVIHGWPYVFVPQGLEPTALNVSLVTIHGVFEYRTPLGRSLLDGRFYPDSSSLKNRFS